jgi:hypothetical protein
MGIDAWTFETAGAAFAPDFCNHVNDNSHFEVGEAEVANTRPGVAQRAVKADAFEFRVA